MSYKYFYLAFSLDPIPSTTNDTVDRLVCIKRNSGCCEGNVTVKVKNCGDFRVYKLKKPHGCPQGYCFGKNGFFAHLSPLPV